MLSHSTTPARKKWNLFQSDNGNILLYQPCNAFCPIPITEIVWCIRKIRLFMIFFQKKKIIRCKIMGKSVCLEHHTSHWYTLSSALTHKHYYFLYPKCSLSCHRWWTKILSYMWLYLFIPSTGFVYSKVYNSIKVARIQRQVIYYSIYSNITWCYACNKGSTFKLRCIYIVA